jgi:hypothetical protein
MRLFRVHVYHAFHHKLTTDLPRSAATSSQNPLQKRQQKPTFLATQPRQKKLQFATKDPAI